MATGVEVIAVAMAIATLTSGFNDGVELVKKALAKWRENRANKTNKAELEKLQRSLMLARSTVQGAYDEPHRRLGQRFSTGDDLARYVLFALAARQEGLIQNLQREDFENANIKLLIASIENTRTAAAKCLQELAARTQRPLPPSQLTPQDKAALLVDYQNLCPSAVLYRTGQAPHSQLAAISSTQDRSSCRQCGAVLVPSKILVPGADASSFALINLSGLFRAHCRAGSGWACIWQARAPSCYGVFRDEKALLKHLLGAHVRQDDRGADVQVDWPADIRHGDLDKCGYSVRINGLQMENQGGNLVVPGRKRITATNVPGGDFLMSGARTAAVEEVPAGSRTASVTTFHGELPVTEPRYEMPYNGTFELSG